MTQRQTLRHAEDIEDKKVVFICMVASPVTRACEKGVQGVHRT